MNRISGRASLIVALTLLFAPNYSVAQDQSNAVANGGIFVKGWTGQVDAAEAAKGGKIDGSRFMQMEGVMHAVTGPSVSYWQENQKADGSYTVMATFTEPKFKNLSGHSHPYGLFVGGNDLGTDNASLLYCMAYGSGKFIVRGFSPAPFKVSGDGSTAHKAINVAKEDGASVSQEIAITVSADAVSCSINGTVVGTYPKADVVGEGKLKSTNGAFGVRFGHNVEATVAGFHMMK